jgi:hypothetical protein
VRGGILRHPLDQLAVVLLQTPPPAELGPDLLDPGGERVANHLQLVDRQDPWPARSGDAELDSMAWERRPEEAAEGRLHGGDLAPQIPASAALVRLIQGAAETRGRRRGNAGPSLPERDLELGQIGHVE